jgi:alkylhydroperoxidase family enzyme
LGVLTDPHAGLRDQVLDSVLKGPGTSDPAVRNAAADGIGVPPNLMSLVDKVHRHAYKVTDEDIARLQPKYGDDQMFEIVVSAALGASRNRLLAGLKALYEA